ncbi:MAG: hypothetical protein E7A79_04825 [Actinomycetaceae bacterium]|mgnify:CR=1 FL=1|nr:hypothetical protein [Actinomycetaceae bacterium]
MSDSFTNPEASGSIPPVPPVPPPPPPSGQRGHRRRSTAAIIGVVAVIVIALVVCGVWWVTDSRKPSFAQGVESHASASLPQGTVSLALEQTEDSIYSLSYTSKKSLIVFEKKRGATVARHSRYRVRTSVKETMRDPRRTLCQTVTSIHCVNHVVKQRYGVVAWDDSAHRWKAKSHPLSFVVIVGEVDGVVIVGQAATVPASTNSPLPSETPVSAITAYRADTGKALWTKVFAKPAVVNVGGGNIAVVLGAAGRDDVVPDPEAALDEIAGQQVNSKIVELVPASGKKSEAQAPTVIPPSPAPSLAAHSPKHGQPSPSASNASSSPQATPKDARAIRSFDFGNAQWRFPKVPAVFEADPILAEEPTNFRLRDGQHLVSSSADPSSVISPSDPDIYLPGPDVPDVPTLFGDIDGDGYEDAVVFLLLSNYPTGGHAYETQAYVWLWDPGAKTARQLPSAVIDAPSCGAEYASLDIANRAVVVAWNERSDSDPCADRASGPRHVVVYGVNSSKTDVVRQSGLPMPQI